MSAPPHTTPPRENVTDHGATSGGTGSPRKIAWAGAADTASTTSAYVSWRIRRDRRRDPAYVSSPTTEESTLFRIVTTLGLAGALAAIAAGPALAAQSNTYAVKAKVTPAKGGTKTKPAKVAVRFAYTVGERAGQQPAAVKRYTIGFAGLRANGERFKKGALVGTGTIDNYVYLSNDPSGAGGFPCAKQLKIYNAGRNRATLSISGDPARCGGVGTLPDIPAKFVPFAGGGTALQFDLPSNILHPIAGLTVAVRSVESSIKRGYLTSVGYKGAKRSVAVTFLAEDGTTSTVKTTG